MLNKIMHQFKRTVWLVTEMANKLDISWASAYSIIHKDLRYHKIYAMQLQTSRNRHAWKCVCNFCSSIMKKERPSCNRLSQAMQHGCTTMKVQANVKAWNGNMSAKWCWHCFGTLWAHPQALRKLWTYNQQCTVLCYTWRGVKTHYS